jgi:hypothetical protein
VQIASKAYIRSHCFAIWDQLSYLETHRSILITPGVELLHSQEEDQYRNENPGSIRPAAECHVCASYVIVCGNVAGGDAGEKCAVGELDVLHGLQRH